MPQPGRCSLHESVKPNRRKKDQKEEPSMSTASAPTRFWGIVALALNSVLQPTGRSCGGTSLPYLRLSPPFQIANALGLIYHSVRLSYAMNIPFPAAVHVVVRRAGLYQHVAGPERRSFFRAAVFIFGALPSLIKAMAIRGDRASTLLALGYFGPFVTLKLIERVGERATLARFDEARHQMPAKTKEAVITFGVMAAVLAFTLHIDICLETVNLALAKRMFGAQPFHENRLITIFSSPVANIGFLSLELFELAPVDNRFVLVGLTLGAGSLYLVMMSILGLIDVWGHWPKLATSASTIAVAVTGTLAHAFFYLLSTLTTLNQFFRGERRRRQKFIEQWIALWTVASIFLYYGYLYDAAGTYKPAWTEWLP